MNIEIKQLDLNSGERINYRYCGTGPETVILLHGNMSSSVHMIPLMESLGEYFTVYAPDMPGFGDSSYNHSKDDLFDYALDIAAWINRLEIDKFHILGWSAGGGVLMELLTIESMIHKIKTVVFLSSTGIEGIKFNSTQEMLLNYSKTLNSYLQAPIKPFQVFKYPKFPTDFEFGNIEQQRKLTTDQLFNFFIYNLNQPDEETYNKNIEASLKQKNGREMLDAINEFQVDPIVITQVRRYNIPVLIIHGQLDLVVPVEEAYKLEHFFGDTSTLKIFDNGGHSLMTDDLDELSKVLLEFFSSHSYTSS